MDGVINFQKSILKLSNELQMHNFTPEDLLEFYYGEMPESLAADLRIQLETNWSLKQKLSVIDEAATRLNKSLISPRPEVISRIMSYASQQMEYSQQ